MKDSLRSPDWASSLFVECPGLEDAEIDGAAPPNTVSLDPGRTVILETTVDRLDKGKLPDSIDLELDRIGNEFDLSRQIRPGTGVDLGSLPIGGYDLQIEGEGLATHADFLAIEGSTEPLVLTVDLEPGLCIELPVACSGCDPPVLTHRLDRRVHMNRPATQSEGPLALETTGEGRWRARICDLPSGEYDFRVNSMRYQSLALHSIMAEQDLQLDPFELVEGVPTRVFVYDGVGLPIAGAVAAVGWGTKERHGSARMNTDSQGVAVFPALETNIPISLWVYGDGFSGQRVRGFAGSDVFVTLTESGRITGRVEADACDDGTVVVEFKQCQGENCSVRAPFVSEAIPDCAFDLEVAEKGHYQLAVRAPDTAPFVEELDLAAGQSHDFGTITLERGAELTVAVYHREDPVPGATVSLVGRCPSKMTDISGRAIFACLEEDAEKVEIRAEHPEYALARLTAEILSSDQELRVDLGKGARVYGRVFNDDGMPASGAEIHASGKGDRRTARIGPDGRYAFEMIAPGSWRLFVVQVSGNMIATGNDRMIQVEDGSDIEVNFLPEVEVTGRVSLDGTPIEDSILAAIMTSAGGGSGSAVRGIKVGPGGVFTALFPAEGLWTFHSPRTRSTVTVQLDNCPCHVDLNLVSESAAKP